ncbi:MAG: hypothetical protein AAF694_13895 [Bacteroidota bacterium]
MEQAIEINPGEVVLHFDKPLTGKITLEELGFTDKQLFFEEGRIRMVFDFNQLGPHQYYRMPTLEMSYKEEMGETHWQCEFNEETLIDKYDHHGHCTVILLNREKMQKLEHHHVNQLILHAEFPSSVHLISKNSYVHFFQ